MTIPTLQLNLRGKGFTLVELLVVIAIIGLISAAALPVVLPALNERRVSEAARILQANLVGIRDAAIKANAPRGLRFLPDPTFNFAANVGQGLPLASNRFVPIEPAPDYSEGIIFGGTVSPLTIATSVTGQTATYLRISAYEYTPIANSNAVITNNPTGWRYNIRQGDKIRFNNSGAYYTVAGPIHGLAQAQNPERFICYRDAGSLGYTNANDEINYFAQRISQLPGPSAGNLTTEYLNLTNGVDDNGDGWIDESCDGIDNDSDGVVDPGFNGIDDDGLNGVDDPREMFWNARTRTYAATEYEAEVPLGVESSLFPTSQPTTPLTFNYVISRRPVVSPNSAETTLPAGVVIDLTTWNAAAAVTSDGATPDPTQVNMPSPERSRLPVDPYSGYVDIMLDQTGRVVNSGAGTTSVTGNTPLSSLPFYHFWLTDREGVVAPLFNSITPTGSQFQFPIVNPNSSFSSSPSYNYLLPMPQGTMDSSGNPYTGQYLQGERRLVTLFAKSGQIVSNSITNFNMSNTSLPYYEAQSGVKESQ